MTVYLVGAGPGDPGLITVRGAEVLGRADVVVYDRLVDPSLLDLAPADAERVYAGKAPGAPEMDQAEINALLVDRARAGGNVVRLKGGDPFVFGRGGEEAEALAATGVPFEVVPGITSAIGAPAYAGIPVTHRGASTHFTVVTGHEDPAKGSADVDWSALARTGGTLVILMGAGRVGEIASRLVEGGLAPDTPVAAVRNGTRPDQETVRATLATVADAGVQAPAAIVVGDVAALDLTWFESRPLFGRSVVVTRAREQASELRNRLEVLGAEVLELPAIAIEPIEFDVPQLDRYGWVVFTSANGVTAFFEHGLASGDLDARALAGRTRAMCSPPACPSAATKSKCWLSTEPSPRRRIRRQSNVCAAAKSTRSRSPRRRRSRTSATCSGRYRRRSRSLRRSGPSRRRRQRSAACASTSRPPSTRSTGSSTRYCAHFPPPAAPEPFPTDAAAHAGGAGGVGGGVVPASIPMSWSASQALPSP